MTEILRELIDMIREMSPMVWSSLVRQAYVSSLLHGIWAIVFSALGFIVIKIAKSYRNLYNKELAKVGVAEGRYGAIFNEYDVDHDSEYTSIILYALGAVLFMIMVALFNAAFARVINPDFYAIQYILDTLK